MRKNIKMGFITIEAAILLPILIVSVLSIAYLIKLSAADEEVVHAMTEELKKTSMYAYKLKYQPLAGLETSSRIRESDSDIKSFTMFRYRYLYEDEEAGISDLITMGGAYLVDVRLPAAFSDSFLRTREITARAFTGRERPDCPDDFSRLERDEDSELVWVFPRAGERYHKEDCPYINVKAYERVADTSLLREREPCSLCEPEAKRGDIVYCFKTGSVYHTALCTSVDRYVISMQKIDAVESGYTPCSKCGA